MWWWHKKEDKAFYHFFRNILGYTPHNKRVYDVAFIHKSCSENGDSGHRVNNERLEYLGDAVLGAIVAEYLYKKYPTADEGFLTETRSKIVSRANLGRIAHRIGLHDLIHYRDDVQGVFKSMEGDAFEALIGAIYLEKGYRFTRHTVIDRIILPYVNIDELTQTVVNHKGRLLNWGQKRHRKVTFRVINIIPIEGGSRRQYEVCAMVGDQQTATAIDYTIKAAEQRAAEKTLQLIKDGELKS
ncbi:MAG: ribonuclease III [Bacteroidales bacterium]|nr:ribonuclease III [Bacteroidales bacterium]